MMREFGRFGFRFLRLSDAAMTWWRCLNAYQSVIAADWVEQIEREHAPQAEETPQALAAVAASVEVPVPTTRA